MSAATIAFTAGPRVPPPLTVAEIPITITLSTTAYATATGGIPFDLTTTLNALNAESVINPLDIIGFSGLYHASGAITGAGVVAEFALGTPTYTAVAGASTQNGNLGTLATCPCTARIYVSGGTAQNVLAEISDANLTGTIVGFVKLARGGHN